MTNVQTFMFALPAGTATMQVPVRTLEIDGAPWFVAKDVCRCLGLKGDVSLVCRRLAHGERSVYVPPTQDRGQGKPPRLTIISEPGLYQLVMRSDVADARVSQDWVTRDVSPAIRKDGAYVMGEGFEITLFRDSCAGSTALTKVQSTALPTLPRKGGERRSFPGSVSR